jgi:hypothetical protein
LSQFPYDEFSKNLLEATLQPLGNVEVARTVASEVREVDLYFVPHTPQRPNSALGLLQRLATQPTSFEPFRNPVAVENIKSCLVKLLDLHGEITKTAQKNKQPSVSEQQLPYLWIITPTLSAQKLRDLRAEVNLEICSSGIYLLAPTLRTGIVVVHQLPEIPDTLWLRIMGRDGVQARAAQEIAALPLGSPYRGEALQLLVNLKVQLEAKTKKSSKDRELIMNLSPLYLEQISQAEQRGEAGMVVTLLNYRLGDLATDLEKRVHGLNKEQLEALGKALLDFREEKELLIWLKQSGV